MFITLDAFKTLFASNPIIVFDTCVYLDLLRFSKKSSNELLKLYNTVYSSLVTVPQINKELRRSILKVCSLRSSYVKDARTQIKNALNACSSSIDTHLNVFQRLKFDFALDYKNRTIETVKDLKDRIDTYTEDILKNDSFLTDQVVVDFFEGIWTRNSIEEYSFDETIDIIRDGEIRFRYKIPPGYKDGVEHGKDGQKEGVETFGDLLMWMQIIKLANSQTNPIIFVTSDLKEDWFTLSNNQPESPREELLAEFREKTNGRDICILPSERFIELLSETKNIDTFEILLEMQSDDFVDRIVSKYKVNIANDFLDWANKDNNIQQFPFHAQVNRLILIENERLVVKNYSYIIKENIEYSVVLEGAAEFMADWQLDFEHIEKNSRVSRAFRFELQIAFQRPYKTNDLNFKEAIDNIKDLRIERVILESIPSYEIDLVSKRGLFTLPSDNDKELFDFMDCLWEDLEKKDLRYNEAEKTALLETAIRFKKTLFEVYRSYFLVQYYKSNREMSLNEIDVLATTRFSSLSLPIETGEVVYKGMHIPFGECYPLPDSMKLLPPETGKELDVNFDMNSEYTLEGKIILHGQTNLPQNTELMITLRKPNSNYSAQSKSRVLAGGLFHSEVFSNGKNPPTFALDRGKYVVEIVMPIFDIQPNDVKVIIGKRSRNLIGKYTSKDGIFGTSVNYEKNIEI